MSIMDVFRGFGSRTTGALAAATAVAAAPAVDPSKGNPTVPGDGTQKSTGTLPAVPAAGEGDKSPLDGYKELWLTTKDDKKPASLEVSMPIDQTKMMEAARTLDFTKALSPAVLAAIQKGDSAGIVAGMNEMAQAAFAQASGGAAKLVEAALNKQAKIFNEQVLPDALRKHEVATSLRTENPAFDNPAVSPMLAMVEAQLQMKYPGASATEITSKAKEYLQATAESIIGTSGTRIVTDKPKEAAAGASKARGKEDWGLFMGLDAAS